jgi:hypothetical protein
MLMLSSNDFEIFLDGPGTELDNRGDFVQKNKKGVEPLLQRSSRRPFATALPRFTTLPAIRAASAARR